MIRVTLETPKSAAFDRIRFGLGASLDKAMERYAFDAAALTQAAIMAKLEAPRLTDLRRSWRIAKPTRAEGGWVSFVYSEHPRAEFRETGGTVNAGVNAAKCGPNKGQKTKALAIPLDAAKTSTFSKQPCSIAGLRWFPNIHPSANNRGVLASVVEKFSNRGKHKGKAIGEIKEVFFALKKSVTVKPTPYYGPALRETEDQRVKMFEHYARQALMGEAS